MAKVNPFPTCSRAPSPGQGPIAVCTDVGFSSVCDRSDGQPASRPFPSSFPRTVLAGFRAHGSPVVGFTGVWRLVLHLPPRSFSFRSTCHPSPCGRLFRPWTTTMTPSPWGSRPLGDLEFLRTRTYQHDLGLPLIPTPGLYGQVSHRRGFPRLKTEVEVLDDIVINRSRDREEHAPIGIRIQTIQS